MRLVKAARQLRVFLWAGMVGAPLLTLAGLVGAWQGADSWAGASFDAGGLALGWATALALAQGALVAAALHPLARLLGEVTPEQLFPPQASRRFGRFATLLLAAALVHGVLPALLAGWLAYQRQAYIALSLDGGDLLSLLVAAVLWLVSRFFDAAARLEEDQRSIV